MPMMVASKKLAPESGVRPKSPDTPKAMKPPTDKDVRKVNEDLRRLGPYPMVSAGPYAAEDYDALTRRRLDWTERRRQLLADKHAFSQRSDNDAIRLRGTVALAAGDSAGQEKARKNATRVRQSEVWRYKQLSGTQRQAEIEMEHVIRVLLGGPSLVAKYGAISGGRDPATLSAAMDKTWRDWRRDAAARGINVEAVVDCIGQPKTMAEIERERGFSAGQGIDNHRRGLDLWAQLRGWTSRSTCNNLLTTEGG